MANRRIDKRPLIQRALWAFADWLEGAAHFVADMAVRRTKPVHVKDLFPGIGTQRDSYPYFRATGFEVTADKIKAETITAAALKRGLMSMNEYRNRPDDPVQ